MTLERDRLPLARAEGLLTERLGDEIVVYDTESKHAHSLGPLAASVFSHADGRTSIARLAEIASAELGDQTPEERIHEALADLDALSLLVGAEVRIVSRRQLIRTGALAGAAVLATPYVTSAITPAAAATCTAIPCTRRSDCESNTCTTGSCVCVCKNGTVPSGNSQCSGSAQLPASCGCRG